MGYQGVELSVLPQWPTAIEKLGPDERREAIGNFTLHAVETIAEANRIEHLVVELMLDPS